MNDDDVKHLRRILKANVAPADAELRRDLWTDVERRLDEKKSVSWFDWILLGAAAACLIGLPQIIPMLLYHL